MYHSDSDPDSEMEESVNSRVDRLSELPNSLIHVILSFLPMRDVILTTLLSKRWKNLWTTVPCLNFNGLNKLGISNEEETEKVRSFVNRTLIFWRGIEILKFKIDIDTFFDSSLAGDIDLWVRFAVENKVEELDIHLVYEEDDMDWKDTKKYAYKAPLCLNSCSSIRKLSLVGCNLRTPVTPPWKKLKSLKIDGFCFGESVINRVLLGSPLLEVLELRLVESYESLNIRSTSLKRLKIEKYLMWKDDEPSTGKMLRIRCPNLEVLTLSGVLYSNYLFSNVTTMLTDVTLGFNGSYDYTCGNESLEETLRQIFSTFKHVDKVTLSYWCVQVLGALHRNHFKVFPNVKMLVVEDQTQDPLEFDAGMHSEFERMLSKTFMQQLKRVDITSSLSNASTFLFIEDLLKDASMLEKLVIRAKGFVSSDWFEVAERLLCIPRSSPTAKVILKKY